MQLFDERKLSNTNGIWNLQNCIGNSILKEINPNQVHSISRSKLINYIKRLIDTNYKLWHDTNSEFYHDFMHYFNRVSGFNDEYFARKNIPFDNGHVNVSSFTVNYEEYDGFEDRGNYLFPICRPTSGIWLTSSQVSTLTYGGVPIVVTQ